MFQAWIFQPVGNRLCIGDAVNQRISRHIVVNLVADIGQGRLSVTASFADILVVNRVQQTGAKGKNRGKENSCQNDCDNRNDVPAFAGLEIAARQFLDDSAVVIAK